MYKSNTKFVVGMDLGDKNHAIYILADGEDEGLKGLVENDRELLVEGFKRFPNPGHVTVAMEAGTHSPWISQLLHQGGFHVLVGNARKIRCIWDSDNKSDGRDAEKLARLARFDSKLLHPITHRGRQAQLDLVVLKARAALVSSRVNLVNFIRGTVKSAGYKLPKCSTKTFAKVVREQTEMEELTPAIRGVLETIEMLNEQIKKYDRDIKLLSESYPESERLQQVPGVGPIVAMTFILTLEDPNKFAKSRQVGAFLGLVPKRDQSGESDKPLSITKAGNVELRKLLVVAANYILGQGPKCDLRSYGERISRRGGTVAKRRAKVAVARKVAVLLHRLWQSGEDYHPFHKTTLTQIA